jgi:hypothetical protein
MNIDCQDIRQPLISRKKGKGLRKKYNASIATRVLGVVLRPDPKG